MNTAKNTSLDLGPEPSRQFVTLQSIAEGHAEELFQELLDRVLENLRDTDTQYDDKREIVLRLQFKASDDDRLSAFVVVRGITKLAPIKARGTSLVLGRHEGRLRAICPPSNGDLFNAPAGKPRPVPANMEDAVS